MGIHKPQPLRLHWDTEIGWIVDVPTLLTQRQLQGIIDWSIPRQIDRWKTLPVGEKKTELENAIKLLQAGKIQQRILEDNNQTFNLFKSTERTTTKVTSYG